MTVDREALQASWNQTHSHLGAARAHLMGLPDIDLSVLDLMLWGLPTHDADPLTTGTLTHGSKITFSTNAPDPVLTGGWPRRMTGTRAEKATRIVVNSVVFRSSGQNLTTAGTYIEMASRLLEPTLLALAALAALAVRGRIKR